MSNRTKKSLIVWLAGLIVSMVNFIPVSSPAQNPFISNDSIIFVENTLKLVTGNKVNFTILPGPVSSPTQKVGLAVLPMLVYNLRKSDTLSPPSSSAILFYLDFYGSWLVAAKQDFYWNDNKWRAFITAGIGEMRIKYFGIGRDTMVIRENSSGFVWSQIAGFNISLSCYRKIYRGLYGGLEYTYSASKFEGKDSAASVVIAGDGFSLQKDVESIFTPSFIWDSRDNIYWSTGGYYASLNLQTSNSLLFQAKSYGVVSGWVNGYHRLIRSSNRLILAWHLYGQADWGELPYARYAIYGTGDEVTGYTRGKYVNRNELAAQAELRYELWKFISCGGYIGTGKTFSSFQVFGQSVWLHYGGLRLYFNIIPSRNIRLMVDGALGRGDWGFYLGIGQAF